MRDIELGYDTDLATTVEATHMCSCVIKIDLALYLRVYQSVSA